MSNLLYLSMAGRASGSGVTVVPFTATENGMYTAPTGRAYSPVTVSTPARPPYSISNGDSVLELYFNTEYSLNTFLSSLTYDETITWEGTTFSSKQIGLGLLYAVDGSALGLQSVYFLVWYDSNDSNNNAILYSTSNVAVTGFNLTAGWQVSGYTPASAISVTTSTILPSFKNIMDYVVAQDDVAFGAHSGTVSTAYNIGSVSTPSYTEQHPSAAGDLPTLTINVSIPRTATIIAVRAFYSYGGYLKKLNGVVATPSGMSTSTNYTTSVTSNALIVTWSVSADSTINNVLNQGFVEGSLSRFGGVEVVYQ